MRNRRFLCGSLLLLAGCDHVVYQPIVDMKGVDPIQYQQDLRECQAYAEQVNPAGEALAGALIGAAAGAAIGSAVGAPSGQAGYGATYGASAGAGMGGVAGTASGMRGQVQVVSNCLIGRGYKVLR